MANEQNLALCDQEILEDILSSQKHATAMYNTYSGECKNTTLQGDMLNILRDEHNMQYSVFQEMEKRGWYKTEQAEQTKVDEAKTKFENIKSDF